MASWDMWMPELQLAAPTAPVPLIHLCLNRATRDFCRRTRAWLQWLDPVEVDGSEHTFDAPMGAELVRVEAATINGQELPVTAAMDASADPVRYPIQGGSFLVIQDLSTFTVGGVTSGQVQVKASLMPTLTGSTIPDALASRWFEALRDGAKAELLATPNVDFYLPDQAAIALAKFQEAIDSAKGSVWRNLGARGAGRGTTVWG